MNRRVAVLAGAPHRECRISARGRSVAEAVTLEAQPRTHKFQRVFNNGAVRIVTVVTVLTHRLMFKQEWPPLLGMARVTSFVDRIFLQKRLGETAVRIVAVRANDLAFAQRHV